MPPTRRARPGIPFSATKLVASTPASRLAFRKKLGITNPAQSRGQAKANRARIAAAKNKIIPFRSEAGIQQRAAARKLRKQAEQ